MKSQPLNLRLLGIALSSKGVGYAVLENKGALADWGVKMVEGKYKNEQALVHVKKLIARYRPDLIVLEDISAKDSRRSVRIKALSRNIRTLALKHRVTVKCTSRDEVGRCLSPDREVTKHELAEILTQKFPKELSHRLPPRRKAWMGEDARMAIFDAVALAVTLRPRK